MLFVGVGYKTTKFVGALALSTQETIKTLRAANTTLSHSRTNLADLQQQQDFDVGLL